MKHFKSINRNLDTSATKRTILIYAIAFFIMAVMAIPLVGSVMRGYDHDENTYCAAGVLTACGQVMYRDFAYLQMPLLPLIYSSLFNILKTTNYLLVGRFFSVVCSILTMFFIFLSFIHAFRSRESCGAVLGISAVVIYALNQEIQHAGSRAWNHSFPILCMVLAYLIAMRIDFTKPIKTAPLFLVGLFNGIAAFTRMSFIFGSFIFFLIFAFLIPVSPGIRVRKMVLPFIFGMILSSVPAIYYFFQAPESFVFDTVQYFLITGAQRWYAGWQVAISIKEKLFLCGNVLSDPSYLILIILFFFSCILALIFYRHLEWRRTPLVLSSLLAISMMTAAFVITPMQIQYFAAPVPFFLITTAYPIASYITTHDKKVVEKIICGASVAVMMFSFFIVTIYEPNTLENIKIIFSKKKSTPSVVSMISMKVGEMVGSDKLILTLAPIFALEGGERIYEEFATGPFLFRYGRFLSADQRNIAVSTDRDSLQTLLQKKPPDAILVGFEEMILEAPLIEYAQNAGWQKRQIDKFSLYMPINRN